MTSRKYSRRQFPLHHTARNRCTRRSAFFSSRFFDSSNERSPLQEFDYSDLTLSSELHEQQGKDNISVLVELSEDRILKPLREMSGQRPPAMTSAAGISMIRTSTVDLSAPALLQQQLSDHGFPLWPARTRSAGTRKSAIKFST
jgi:hypothetical protein